MEMPDNLTESEKYLIAQVAKGEFACYASGRPENDKPANSANWGPERTIRANVIRVLCISNEKYSIDPKGIWILGARIEGELDLGWVTVLCPLLFIACHFNSPVSLHGAHTRDISLAGSFLAQGLSAFNVNVKGDLLLTTGFISSGEVNLMGANIDGQLGCDAGTFINFRTTENSNGHAISADRLIVKGHVFLRQGFVSFGEVRLPGAEIGGQLACDGGKFFNPGALAINAHNLSVKGNVYLTKDFKAEGEVNLYGADIGGNLECIGGSFNDPWRNENPMNFALMLQNTLVAGPLLLTNTTIHGFLNLRNAVVDRFEDDIESWPEQNMLLVDGYEYGALFGNSPIAASQRLKWLMLQPTNNKLHGFRPQPYEQLAKVLRAMGHERDARIIAIAKQKEMRKRLGPMARAWSWILRISTGYGYETWRAFIGMALMVAIGTAVFCFTNGNSDMVATSDGAYVPIFNAFIYSLDAFLPIVDLHQESYWLPQSEPFKWYLWFHISAGWILSTISVAAFTGLFKDE